MKMDEIRKQFLEYFEKQGHRIVPSSSLVPGNDPTLLFTNAGMNQFKDVFLGLEKRDYARATSSQKCFRVSGKHNDLENVGVTARHHTFFEMLGNFSFGDYFKREAIGFAWDLITVEMGIEKDKLWITVYEKDEESYELWQEVAGLKPERIVRMGEKDNFWAMGDTGPCGPCSEIIIDQGEGVGCGRPDCKIGCECDRFLELWNLVFMQYSRDNSGRMEPLPRPSIDTGIGLERIAAVMQGVHSNYETDLFRDIIAEIENCAGREYGENRASDVSMQVIADHARAMAFLITDGIIPANEGRGYVLRRIMRRAGRHAKMIGIQEPVLYKIANKVVELMGNAFQELKDRKAYLEEVIKNEEERFLLALDTGLRLLNEETEKHRSDKKPWILPGSVAFRLYDTYGFPLDLTETIGRDEGFEVDTESFDREMKKQQKRAREHWKGSGDAEVEEVYKHLRSKNISSEFTGYKRLAGTAQVKALVLEGQSVDIVTDQGAEFQLVTDRTPFYGESGGQAGDTGCVKGKGMEAEVLDTRRPVQDLIVHLCRLSFGGVKIGNKVRLEVNKDRRLDTMRNHSATHLLQAALQETLGKHVQQKGSLVTPDRLRFDFTHFSPASPEELARIERRVNELIRENARVSADIVPYQEAINQGAMALFGEKYGSEVRMVKMGDVSRELCGGTHVNRTGDIGFFKIIGESSVAAGVRRIEALTGRSAIEHIQGHEETLEEASRILKTSPADLIQRIHSLQEEGKKLRRELKDQKERRAGVDIGKLMNGVKEVTGVKVLATEVDLPDPRALRELSDRLRDKIKSGIIVLGSKADNKALLLVAVTKDLKERYHAGEIISELAKVVGGKGGGRPDMAQAGGPYPEKVKHALKKAFEILDRTKE